MKNKNVFILLTKLNTFKLFLLFKNLLAKIMQTETDKSIILPAGRTAFETCVSPVSIPGGWTVVVSNPGASNEDSTYASKSCKEFRLCPDKTVPHRHMNMTYVLGIGMVGCSLKLFQSKEKSKAFRSSGLMQGWSKSTESAQELFLDRIILQNTPRIWDYFGNTFCESCGAVSLLLIS